MDAHSVADLRIRENLTLEERAKDVKVSFSVQEIDQRTNRLHVDVSGSAIGLFGFVLVPVTAVQPLYGGIDTRG